MSNNKFTLEVYKKDKRIKSRSESVRWGKNKPGLRFVLKQDYEGKTRQELEELCRTGYPESLNFIISVLNEFNMDKINGKPIISETASRT